MTTKNELIVTVEKRAHDLFYSKKYNCAESTFMALNEELGGGLDTQTAARIATGLGGGLGASGGTCGALTGCVLALGLLAKESPDSARKKTIYPMAAKLQKRFRERFGSCSCRELIRDMGKQRRSRCSAITADAAAMCAAMLLEDEPAG